MIKNLTIKKIEHIFIALELLGVVATLIMGFIFEFVYQDIPCPLCLLQRLGFLGIACGFLMNLRFGLRPSHYAMTLLSALFTSFVALRQVALHVVPGTGAYGSPFWGLHLYTWSFIISMVIIITTTLMLGVDRQYQGTKGNRFLVGMMHLLFAIVVFLLIANIMAVFSICGIGECPDNP